MKVKVILVLASLMMGTLVHATEVKVDSVPLELNPAGFGAGQVALAGFGFELNQKLGRARLNIDYVDNLPCRAYEPGGQYCPPAPESSQVLVPGLTFDASSSEVVYKDDKGKVVVCATVKNTSGFFGHRTHIKKTGNCFLTSKIGTKDDGFNVSKVLDVYFNTKN